MKILYFFIREERYMWGKKEIIDIFYVIGWFWRNQYEYSGNYRDRCRQNISYVYVYVFFLDLFRVDEQDSRIDKFIFFFKVRLIV